MDSHDEELFYTRSALEANTDKFRELSKLLLDLNSIPYLEEGEVFDYMEWDEPELQTSYELFRSHDYVEGHLQKSLIQLTIAETYPDGQKSVKAYTTTSVNQGCSVTHLQTTREEDERIENKFRDIEKDEDGDRVVFEEGAETTARIQLTMEILVDIIDKALQNLFNFPEK